MSSAIEEKLAKAALRAVERDPSIAAGGAKVVEMDMESRVKTLISHNDAKGIFELAQDFVTFSRTNLGAWQVMRADILANFPGVVTQKSLDAAMRQAQAKIARALRGDKQEIQVNNRELHEISGLALNALQEANDPAVMFVRSGEIVHVEADESGRSTITTVTEDFLRGRMARCAFWLRSTPTGEQATAPPLDAVRDILSLSPHEWGFPPLVAVVEIPTLRPDGSILDQPGYDVESQMYYAPAGIALPPVPAHPETDDIAAALEFLDEAIGEFPFVRDCPDDPDVSSSKANLLGLLLTPIVRPTIAGCTPMALIDAPSRGTGKSLLVDVFSVIATGRPGSMQPFPSKEEEIQKSIGSTLLGGHTLVCFDNLEGPLKSPNLALVLTAKEYQCRILGSTKNMIAANRATWLVTGNNITPKRDMPRRCYQIRLDAQSSTPFTGRTFRHPNLLGWTLRNRSKLLHALLVIARGWFAAGKPLEPVQALGSFEEWHRTIAGILAYAGVPGFLGNLRSLQEDADDSNLQWENFLSHLHGHYAETPFTAGELADALAANAELNDTVPTETFRRVDQKDKKDFAQALGNAFHSRNGSRFGSEEVRIEKVGRDTNRKIVQWRVCVAAG